ncbi:MAG: PAS domain S-box protein, partial [Desulfomonile tiedjei]|nr:PAS domain S-box protein [Desulfomonile tiedjei]
MNSNPTPSSRRFQFIHSFCLRVKMLIGFGLLFASAFTLVIMIITFGIPFTSYTGWYGLEQTEVLNNLTLVADLKKERLVLWLEERGDDARTISASMLTQENSIKKIGEALRRAIASGKTSDQLRSDLLNQESSSSLSRQLSLVLSTHKAFQKAQIADLDSGIIMASTDDSDVASRLPDKRFLAGTSDLNDETAVDIQKLSPNGKTYLIMARSIGDESSRNSDYSAVRAVIVLYVDTDSFIRPLLYTGGSLGETGDIVLVNRDARIIMSLKYPLPDGSIPHVLEYQIKAKPAFSASQGREGIEIGEDYRGVPVLAAYRHVKASRDLGLGMVIKQDQSEVFSPLQHTILYSSLVGLVALLAVGLLAVLIAKRISRPVENLIQAAEEVQKGNLSARTEIFKSDELGTLAVTFNSMIERFQNWHEELENQVMDRTARLTRLNNELAEEIRQRIRAEESLKETNRRLRTLSDCNQSVVRASEESSLLHEVCRIVVDTGGYPSVWVGFVDDGEYRTPRTVARWGFEVNFDGVDADPTDGNNGADPTGAAVRTGQVCILRNAMSDPVTAPWRDELTRYGIGSFVSIPLLVEGQVVGAITIAAGESHAFDEEELRLLGELAGDLAYGIEVLRTRAERREAVESAARANREWERTFDAISDLVMVLDDKHRVMRANRAMANTLGKTEQDLVGRFCFELVHGEKAPPVLCPHSRLLVDGDEHSAEVVEPRLGGIYDVRVSPLTGQNGELRGSVHTIRDITPSKQSEEALRESEQRYRAVFDNAGIGIVLVDRNGVILQANIALLKMLGYTDEDFRGLTVTNITHPEDREISKQSLDALAGGKFDSYTLQKRYMAHDGSIVWADLSVSIIRDAKGQITGTVGVIADITKRKESEARLGQSEERLRLITDSSPIGIVVVQQGKIAYVNPRLVEMFGYETADETIGLAVETIYV